MEKTTPEIDTAKLRRLMRERNQAFEHSRHLTDRFLEIRDQIRRHEGVINKSGRRVEKLVRARELASLEALKEERDQIQSDREVASTILANYDCVDRLVEYAHGIGLVVNEERCTVRRKHAGEPMRVQA